MMKIYFLILILVSTIGDQVMADSDQKIEKVQNSKMQKHQETQLTKQQTGRHLARSANQDELEPMIKIIEQQSELIKQRARIQQATLLQESQQMQQLAEQMEKQAKIQQASLLQESQQMLKQAQS